MPASQSAKKRGLLERLDNDFVLCAEGYLFELERRGRLQAGSFVPEVALEHPESLLELHREFIAAGSDVVEAFTYNAHREKMRIMGKEHLLEPLNRAALEIAKKAASEAQGEQPLVAGNVSNTNIFNPDDPASTKEVRAMFEEMCAWAVDAGVDYIIGETFYFHQEAAIALEVIRATGLPAVITHGLFAEGVLHDGYSVEDSCARLADMGADVVGMNCFRGPGTMLPHLKKIAEKIPGRKAALPVPYRTTEQEPTFFHLSDQGCPHCRLPYETTFPTALEPMYCTRYEMADFARQAHDLGYRYLGVCCGCAPIHIRSMAEELGRTTPASKYSPDMSKQFLFGDDPGLSKNVTNIKDKA